MPTNISDDGEYPLGDDIFDEIFKLSSPERFDYLWRNYLSLIPPLDKMTWDQREELKEFTRTVFNSGLKNVRNEIFDITQENANIAYRDGCLDTKERIKTNIVEFIDGI